MGERWPVVCWGRLGVPCARAARRRVRVFGLPAEGVNTVEDHALDLGPVGRRRAPCFAERFDGAKDGDVAAAVGSVGWAGGDVAFGPRIAISAIADGNPEQIWRRIDGRLSQD